MVSRYRMLLSATILASLQGCAGLTFNSAPKPDALTYYEAVPYLVVSISKDCVATQSLLMLPGEPRSIGFHNGYGTAELSVALTNGMISSVGQKTNSEVPETLTAISGMATAPLKALAVQSSNGNTKVVVCEPLVQIYSITNGLPSDKPLKSIEGTLTTVDTTPDK